MAKQVILAVAGAGKTYHICHHLDPRKRNLIIAFTNENIHNIQRELYNAYGGIPKLTTVSTFDSFVYHQLILPYEPSIAEYFDEPNFISRGILMKEPPSNSQFVKGRKFIKNERYKTKDQLGHYVFDNQYYCSRLSELALEVKQKGKVNLIRRGAARINLFYDCVLIDEFQDFRKKNYELIMGLSKYLPDVLLVGDYYQHSVSGKNNSGKPFVNSKKETIGFQEFIRNLRKDGFVVDLLTLSKSRRCTKDICKYIRNKLGIQIESCNNNVGSIIWINENAEKIIEDSSIIKLVYSEAEKYTFRAMNWSYAKGDTFDEVCVILTDNFENLDDSTFLKDNIPEQTLNKLYVAMTRSRGNLYLIKNSVFKKIKRFFIKTIS